MKFPQYLISAVFAAAALAQPPGPPAGAPPTPEQMVQRRVDMLANRLSLTDAQKQQATTIFTDAASSEATVRQSMHSANQALSDAVKKNDLNGIEQAANQIGTLTAQLTSIDGKANAAFYQILTPDQQSKFGMFPPEGRGGFNGRGGPGQGPAGGRRQRQ